MIEKDQDPRGQAERVGDLEDRKAAGLLSRHQLMDLGEQLCHIHVVIERHDRKGRPAECDRGDKRRFQDMPELRRSLLILISNDNIRLA